MTPNINDGGVKRAVGRPLGSPDKLKRTSKERADRDALAVLREIATDKAEPSAVRVQAAQIILTHGAARQEEEAHA
jgi:hypothetical protein